MKEEGGEGEGRGDEEDDGGKDGRQVEVEGVGNLEQELFQKKGKPTLPPHYCCLTIQQERKHLHTEWKSGLSSSRR